MKKYYRLRLGSNSEHAEECYNNNFVGISFGFTQDLSSDLTENQIEFNQKFVPIRMEKVGGTKIAAGQACASVWKIVKGIQKGDVIVCPNSKNSCFIGEVISDYIYAPETRLPQRREIKWNPLPIDKTVMSSELRSSIFGIGTLRDISGYEEEIEAIADLLARTDVLEENPEAKISFGFEKQLENFLVENWKQTELGKKYDIYEEDGEVIGQQYRCDNGAIIDILAISKDKKELLVVELKRGRASDVVLGQIQRYMGYIFNNRTNSEQIVKGVIIATEEDAKLKDALVVASNIDFYRYELSFKLTKI